MICNVEINDKNLKEALYTLFGKTALHDLIKETVNQDLEYVINNKDNTGVFVDEQRLKTFIKIPENYKERLYIEYKELEDRCNKLSAMLKKCRNNSLDFTLSCSYELLEKQLQVMLEYKNILEERAKIEKISLE